MLNERDVGIENNSAHSNAPPTLRGWSEDWAAKHGALCDASLHPPCGATTEQKAGRRCAAESGSIAVSRVDLNLASLQRDVGYLGRSIDSNGRSGRSQSAIDVQVRIADLEKSSQKHCR